MRLLVPSYLTQKDSLDVGLVDDFFDVGSYSIDFHRSAQRKEHWRSVKAQLWTD